MPSLLPHYGQNSHKARGILKLLRVKREKGKVYAHIWSIEPQGFRVCVCVGVLLWAFPPTLSPIPNLDWKAKKRMEARQPERRCAHRGFGFSHEPRLTFLSPSATNLFTESHSKHKYMSRLLSIYLWSVSKRHHKLITCSYSELIKYCHWVWW